MSNIIEVTPASPSDRLDDFVGKYDSYIVADFGDHDALLEIAYFEHSMHNITVMTLTFGTEQRWGVDMFTRNGSMATIPSPEDDKWERAESYLFHTHEELRAYVRDFNDAMLSEEFA